MKLYVKTGDKWIVVPCSNEHGTVGSVIAGAKKRFSELGVDVAEKDSHLTSPGGHVVYSNNDVIKDVLQDQEFLELRNPGKPISLLGDLPDVKPSSEKSAFEAKNRAVIVLDGKSLTTETLCSISSGNFKIQLSSEADAKVKRSRAILDEIVEQHKIVYGVSTGFGKFARVAIPEDQLGLLQDNLIESHCAGVGPPLSPQKTRMLLAVRINILSKGYSGISPESLATLVKAFNCSCLPWIPELGTVGASGDLAPLSHMALGLCGKGRMWSPESGWAEAADVLKAHAITPLSLKAKEGLALINGTQFISSIGSEAVERARRIALQADVITALTLEALNGTSRAFDEAIHDARPHKGQREVAKRLRTLLQYGGEQSEITVNHRDCDRVQDAYTLRCCPQVHGIAHDTIAFVKSILDVELNSATDNPMVLIERGETISGGNFHGEYPAKALDFLAIGAAELGSISERRIERMCNPAYSDLPAFLVNNGGLNSGFMIPHCTAAALVSENKCLCHPSSVDSLSTSAGQEDHVSMGGWAARKALKVVEHVEQVLAIELLCACQGIEFHRPLKTTQALEAVHRVVREVVAPYDKDRVQSTDIDAVSKLLRENRIWEAVESFIDVPIKKIPMDYSSSPTSSYLNKSMNREV